MRRLLIAVFASLLAVAVIAPAAHGATKYRYWQDLSVSGPYAGKVVLTIAYEDTNGNRKFKPRYAAAYELLAQTSCESSADVQRHISGNAFNKYGYFKEKLTNKGRFSHRFESQFPSPAMAPIKGELHGTVLKRLKRRNRVVRTARVNGGFNIEDWDQQPETVGCLSAGSFSATPCKRWRSKRDRPRWWKEWKAPVCAIDPW